jgi:hypothetical protein
MSVTFLDSTRQGEDGDPLRGVLFALPAAIAFWCYCLWVALAAA